MIARKGKFYGGVGMMAAFIVVLVIIFSPVFKGQNGLDALDSLYNSISKGSAYYIPKIRKEVGAFTGSEVNVKLALNSEKQAKQTASLFMKSGTTVNRTGSVLKVSGNLGRILAGCLDDADTMYYNNREAIVEKYSVENARRPLFNWWTACKAMEKDLKNQMRFKEAKIVTLVNKKAVEPSYNYYRIEPQNISDSVGVVIFSLVFYVVYTLWYGFAILFMFEGWGLKLEH